MVLEGKTYLLPSPSCIGDIHEITEQNFDLAILAIKTYHLEAILPDIAALREYFPPVLSLLNGVESETMLAGVLGGEQVIPGTVTTSVDRIQKGDVIVRRARGIGIAGSHPFVLKLLPVCDRAGLNPRYYPQADSMKWSKLLTNLLGNASSAILNLPPSQIFSDPDLFNLEMKEIREALAVMQSLQIKPVNLPGIPVKLLAFLIKNFPENLIRPLLANMIGGGRGDKMPSFQIDLYAGRGNSEVDQLNGAVVKAGAKLNIPTPVNRLLTGILSGLVEGKEPLEKYADQPKILLDLLADQQTS